MQAQITSQDREFFARVAADAVTNVNLIDAAQYGFEAFSNQLYMELPRLMRRLLNREAHLTLSYLDDSDADVSEVLSIVLREVWEEARG